MKILIYIMIIPIIYLLLHQTFLGRCVLMVFKIIKECIMSLYYCLTLIYRLVQKLNQQIYPKKDKTSQDKNDKIIQMSKYKKVNKH